MEQIGLIGTGRLGICVALTLEKNGYEVICNDKSIEILNAIDSRSIQSYETGVSELLEKSKNLRTVRSIEEMSSLKTFFCVVATPSLPDGSYSHAYIEDVFLEFQRVFKDNTVRRHLVICCTTMPGYCDTLQERLAHYMIDVSYNPEFIAQGAILKGMENPDMVLIGEASKDAGDELETIYKKITLSNPTICRMSRKEAELTKISINCFITTKISFANTIGDLCVLNGLNHKVVLNAIGKDSRIGGKYLGWGHGYGGPCFPRDNRALCLWSDTQGYKNLVGEATDSLNSQHLNFLFQKIQELKKTDSRPLLFKDLAYKPETTIIEESQSLALAMLCASKGYSVFVQETASMKKVLEEKYDCFTFLELDADISGYILIDNRLTGILSF